MVSNYIAATREQEVVSNQAYGSRKSWKNWGRDLFSHVHIPWTFMTI